MLCIPAVALAHGAEVVFIFSIPLTIFLTAIISLILLKWISKRIVIINKLLKFIVLFMIEIVFVLLLSIFSFFLLRSYFFNH